MPQPAERPPKRDPAAASHTWTTRVRWVGDQESTVYARNNAFVVGQPASFKQTDPHPSAIEYLLGATGGVAVQHQICEERLQTRGIDTRHRGRVKQEEKIAQ